MEAEDPAKKNWAEEVDEDEDEAANQTIGNSDPKPEEEKKTEPAKVYNLAPRERNAYGDFIVKNVVIKEKEVVANAEEDDVEEEEDSDEEDDND